MVNAERLSRIKAMMPDDIELVCTGNQMKWISLSQTEQARRFVFVDPPVETQDYDAQQLCPNHYSNDLNHELALQSAQLNEQFVAYKALVQTLVQQPYTSFAYASSFSRAPPRLS